MRRVAPCAAWAAQHESCELQAELRRKPVSGDDVSQARERVLMRLTELLRKQPGGLNGMWRRRRRACKSCAAGTRRRGCRRQGWHEVEMFQRMRVAELVEETARRCKSAAEPSRAIPSICGA